MRTRPTKKRKNRIKNTKRQRKTQKKRTEKNKQYISEYEFIMNYPCHNRCDLCPVCPISIFQYEINYQRLL